MTSRNTKQAKAAGGSGATESGKGQGRSQLAEKSLDSSPMDRVINTAELLEMILLCLDMYQLFVIQRTSKQFQGVIKGSLELRRKMWLECMSDEEADIHSFETRPVSVIKGCDFDYLSFLHNEPEANRFYMNPLLWSSLFVPKLMVEQDLQYGLVLEFLIRFGNLESLRLACRSYELVDAPAQNRSCYPTRPFHRIPLHESRTAEPSWRRMLVLNLKTERFEIMPVGFSRNLEGAGEDSITLGQVMDQIGDHSDRACIDPDRDMMDSSLMTIWPNPSKKDSPDESKYQKVGLDRSGSWHIYHMRDEILRSSISS